MSALDDARGDWRERLSVPPEPRTLPELVQLALDLAAEDAHELAGGARAAFEQAAGYDLYDAIRGVLNAFPDPVTTEGVDRG